MPQGCAHWATAPFPVTPLLFSLFACDAKGATVHGNPHKVSFLHILYPVCAHSISSTPWCSGFPLFPWCQHRMQHREEDFVSPAVIPVQRERWLALVLFKGWDLRGSIKEPIQELHSYFPQEQTFWEQSSSWLPAPALAPIDTGIHTPCSAWQVQCQAVSDGELSYPSCREAVNVCSMSPHPGWHEKSWFFDVTCCRKWHSGDWHTGDTGRISLPAVLPRVLWCGPSALWCSCVGSRWELYRVQWFPSLILLVGFTLTSWISLPRFHLFWTPPKTHRSFLCFLALGKSGNQYSEAADVPEPIAWNSDSALRLCWVWGSVCADTLGLHCCKTTSLFLFRLLKGIKEGVACVSSHLLPHSGSVGRWAEVSPWTAQLGQWSAKTGFPLLWFVQ